MIRLLVITGVIMFSQNVFAGVQDFLLDPLNKCEIKTNEVKIEDEINITYSEYVNKKKSNKKAILILPPTGGKNILDKGYASFFCKKGYRVLILENWTGLYDEGIDFRMHQRYQTRFQKTVAHIISNIQEEKIGVLGASAGAINFSVTLGVSAVVKKVNAFVGIVSGGPLCRVIANAGEVNLVNLKEKRKKEFGIQTQEEYEKNICDNLEWDLAKEKPEHLKLFLITSKRDETVLTKLQINQVKNMRPDLHIDLDTSHRGAVVSSFLLYRGEIAKFFKESL